jgi:hypothetical protein
MLRSRVFSVHMSVGELGGACGSVFGNGKMLPVLALRSRDVARAEYMDIRRTQRIQ